MNAARVVLADRHMNLANVSACGRFVVLPGLHLDRHVFETLASWATKRGLDSQAAVQLAVCAFNDSVHDKAATAVPPSVSSAGPIANPRRGGRQMRDLRSVSAERENELRVRLLPVSHGVDADERSLGLGCHDVEPEPGKLRAKLGQVVEVARRLPYVEPSVETQTPTRLPDVIREVGSHQ